MNNPYQVLGVSENATDEQIKEAYRNLAKKYHPDNYQDSPLADVAEEKMKEVNEAYDAISQMRNNGHSSDTQYASYGTTNNTNYSHYPEVRQYIFSGRLADAEQILAGVPQGSRGAEWYFLMGMIYSKKGFVDQSFQFFQTAVQLEPDNQEYQAAYRNILNRRTYKNPGYNSANPGCSVCDICTSIICADMLCNCCQGPCC